VRRLPPVYSPITLRALLAGAAGVFRADQSNHIVERVAAQWAPRDCLLTGSGTAALTLALKAAIDQKQPLIALPAYGCYDLATAADGAKSKVVLYDLDPETLGPRADSLQRALAHKPAAVVLVHQYGIPVDVSAVRAQCDTVGAIVIEDAAQAVGAALRSKALGSFGSLAILSFGRGKGLTGGSGGALLANDAGGATLLSRVRHLSQTREAGWGDLIRAGAQWLLGRPGVYAIPAALPFLRLGETIYHEPAALTGLSKAAAPMLDSVWARSLEAAATRRGNAAVLLEAARKNNFWRAINMPPDARPGYLRLPLLLTKADQKSVLNDSAVQLGITPGYPMPLNQLPGFRDRCVNLADGFPGAELLSERLITLPTHALLSSNDRNHLVRWLTGRAN
jgi:perosamine synthetase